MMQRPRFRLVLALMVCAASLSSARIAPADEKKLSPTVVPASREDDWWQKRHNQMNERVKKGNVDLLFIGDSITQGWEGAGKEVWSKYYEKRNAVNLGIGGDRTQHVLWRLEHGNIDGIKPKAAVLMIGTNNSGTDTPEHIAEGVAAIVGKLRKALPETKILVLAIFPRGKDDQDPKRQVNMKANESIAKLADNKSVFYQDLANDFLEDDRALSKKIMPDLLHLSQGGYEIWAQAIEPTLVTLLGEK